MSSRTARKPDESVEIAVIGAGIAGIATAYFLCAEHGRRGVALVDPLAPMSLTSARSGENYRAWWPDPAMVAFTGRSIDLMERLARDSGGAFAMTRRGYALATRESDVDGLLAALRAGGAPGEIRVHDGPAPASYRPPSSDDWRAAPDGVDLLRDRRLIRAAFPSFDPEVAAVAHIRRAGDLDGQGLGAWMLERVREAGGRRVAGRLRALERAGGFRLDIAGEAGPLCLRAEALVIAAGPFTAEVAAMLGVALPIETVVQQKIAFEDRERAIPRAMPFAVDLDARSLDWTPEERALLAEDPDSAWLARPIPGGIHCRPDGGPGGTWVRLGWAYNRTPERPVWEPALDPRFPEIVLRGAAGLHPALRAYYGRLPRGFSHYGGYYAMTPENWPLIGPLAPGRAAAEGAFVVGALSGFGTMAACAAGELCAAWIAGAALPGTARALSPARLDDATLMAELRAAPGKGLL